MCWSWLNQNLKGHNPRTWGGRRKAILHAWDEVQLSIINRLLKRVPRQVEEIEKANSESFRMVQVFSMSVWWVEALPLGCPPGCVGGLALPMRFSPNSSCDHE